MILRREKWKVAAIAALLTIGYGFYFYQYYFLHRKNYTDRVRMAKIVRESSQEEDVVVVLGMNWGAEIPYYSERKCICLPYPAAEELKKDPELFLKKLHTPNIKHVAFAFEATSDREAPYCKKIRELLKLRRTSTTTDGQFVLFSR